MTRATFGGNVIAESNDVKRVEGITYFPTEDVRTDLLVESPTTTRCFWKGKASYWHVQGADDLGLDAAFAYENPWPLGKPFVKDRVGFWRGVQIEE